MEKWESNLFPFTIMLLFILNWQVLTKSPFWIKKCSSCQITQSMKMTEKQNLKWKWMENPITANQSQIKSYASDKHQLSHSHLMIDGQKKLCCISNLPLAHEDDYLWILFRLSSKSDHKKSGILGWFCPFWGVQFFLTASRETETIREDLFQRLY